MKDLVILGSTGSIGVQALEIVEANPALFRVVAISAAGTNPQALIEQAKKFKVSYNENVSLYTIRHFDENAAKVVETNKTILLRQISRDTMQVITKE